MNMFVNNVGGGTGLPADLVYYSVGNVKKYVVTRETMMGTEVVGTTAAPTNPPWIILPPPVADGKSIIQFTDGGFMFIDKNNNVVIDPNSSTQFGFIPVLNITNGYVLQSDNLYLTTSNDRIVTATQFSDAETFIVEMRS